MSADFQASRDYALLLDQQDPLARYRSQFIISDPDLIYLDGNSLGRLPKVVIERMKTVIENEWGGDLVRGWNEGWWDAPTRVGEKIAQLVGASAGQVIVCDSVSINLFKLAVAALELQTGRTKIITDTFNFPSDLYVLQGATQLLGSHHKIVHIGSRDGDITPDLAALESELDNDTALVTFSHVVFKSGYLYDMERITRMAHDAGALVLWDLSHSVGTVPIVLDACNADFAVGCTYKYLNGGPGAQAFLYVRKELQEKTSSPIWAWWGQNTPFDFDLDYIPASDIKHFLTGSQPILSLLAMEESLNPTLEAGMEAIRAKSVRMTEYAIALHDALLAPVGFTLGSPRDAERRGSHISVRHADGYRINRALIEEMNLIPDFRAPDNIRLGFAPLYTSFAEIWDGMDRIRRVVEEKRYEKYSQQRLTVT
ncbi:MAG: kynureninase [Chloroflexi bacterium]|nr:kynureninase [Chloroflexota bacterium]